MRKPFLIVALIVASLTGAQSAWAQAYPARPVKVVVPFAPGAATDIVARLVADNCAYRLARIS